MKNLVKKILFPLQTNDLRKLFFIFILTVVAALFELLGIGPIIPILNIFVGNDFQKYTEHFAFLSNLSMEEILNFFLISLVLIYFLKFFILKSLIYVQNDFSHKLFTDISRTLFKKYLYKNFSFHLNRNSSGLIRNVQSEANLFSFGVVFPIVKLLSEILIFLSICTVLIIYEWQASLITITLMSLVGYILLKLTNERLKKWGKKRQFHSALTLKHLQQSFPSIKEIILNNLESIFLNKYHHHNLENAKAGKNKDTITQLPRLIMELIGATVFLILIIFLLNLGKDITEIFVIIGVFFFASTRLLPSISKIAQSIQSIKFNYAVIDLIYNELTDLDDQRNKKDNELLNQKGFDFKKINFDRATFSYPESKKKILKNINIEIKKGDKIGIIGKTGSGKSTFINLFCGLLKTQSGNILLNEKNLIEQQNLWQNKIGYVPQNVSIIDESILFNICLEDDEDKIDLKKVNKILRIVELYDYIYSLPKNIHEFAGESGKKLSGGQCQRIGIARALYKDFTILVLDEATSSLDLDTENLILKKLFGEIGDKTILTISHRHSSLQFCDKVVEVKDASLIEVKSADKT